MWDMQNGSLLFKEVSEIALGPSFSVLLDDCGSEGCGDGETLPRFNCSSVSSRLQNAEEDDEVGRKQTNVAVSSWREAF